MSAWRHPGRPRTDVADGAGSSLVRAREALRFRGGDLPLQGVPWSPPPGIPRGPGIGRWSLSDARPPGAPGGGLPLRRGRLTPALA